MGNVEPGRVRESSIPGTSPRAGAQMAQRHGETREGEFKRKPRQTYRVGLVKNNLEYLDEFDRGEHGPNIFDVSQVKAASQDCRKILKAIADLRSSIPVSDQPYEEDPNDPADWPPPPRRG